MALAELQLLQLVLQVVHKLQVERAVAAVVLRRSMLRFAYFHCKQSLEQSLKAGAPLQLVARVPQQVELVVRHPADTAVQVARGRGPRRC